MSCPICHAPTKERWRPFCSRRCADLDLHRWLRGGYAIAGEPADATAEIGPDDDNEDPASPRASDGHLR